MKLRLFLGDGNSQSFNFSFCFVSIVSFRIEYIIREPGSLELFLKISTRTLETCRPQEYPHPDDSVIFHNRKIKRTNFYIIVEGNQGVLGDLRELTEGVSIW